MHRRWAALRFAQHFEASSASPNLGTNGSTSFLIRKLLLFEQSPRPELTAHRFRHLRLGLLREFYDESLVDHGTILFWLSLQVGLSNIIQLGFIIKVVQEYHEALLHHRGFLRPFIVGLIEKLIEVRKY